MEEIWIKTVAAFGTEERAFVFGTFLVHETVFIVGNLWLALLYHFEWPFFERYRIQVLLFSSFAPLLSSLWTF